MTLEQLRQARAKALADAKALVDQARKDGLTDETRANLDELKAEADRLKSEIEKREEQERFLSAIDAEYATLSRPQSQRAAVIPVGAGHETDAKPQIEVPVNQPGIDVFRHAFPNMPHSELYERVYKAGKALRAMLFDDAKAAKWVNDNAPELRTNIGNVGGGDGSVGAYVVPEILQATIIDIRQRVGVVRGNVPFFPMGTDSTPIPKLDAGYTVYYPGQGLAITPSQLTFGQVPATASEWAILTQVSAQLDADAVIALAALIASRCAYSFAYAEDDNAFNGDGTATYNSITGVIPKINGVTSGSAGLVTAATTHTTVAKIDREDVMALTAALPGYQSMTGPKFYCSKSIWDAVLANLVVSSGGATTMNSQIAGERQFFGYPVVCTEVLPKNTATSGVVLLFGHLDYFIACGERQGFDLARSTEYGFANNMITYRALQRVAMTSYGQGTHTDAGTMVALELASA